LLFLILADSEIELVPSEIAEQRSLVRRARRRGKEPNELLLDSNTDHRAMKLLPDGSRRGRPDIAHMCLLNALGSIPSREGRLRCYVHTRDDIVLGFEPRTRIPRSQGRFYGLIESILARRRGTELISYREINLEGLLTEIQPDVSLGFSSRGDSVDLQREMAKEGKIVAIVGGFPKGYFMSPVEKLVDRMVSLYDAPLDAWTAVNEVLCAYSHSRRE